MSKVTNGNATIIDTVSIKAVSGEYFYYANLSFNFKQSRYIEILADSREEADKALLGYLNNTGDKPLPILIETANSLYPFYTSVKF